MMKKAVGLIVVIVIVFSCKNEKPVADNVETLKESQSGYAFKKQDSIQLYKGSLHRIDSFPSKYVVPRPVDVWLPEDYTKNKTYAVLYMHDGQMLFDASSTWNKQEWKVDEWATKLMQENKTRDFIVVAVHNISELRWQDLFPQKAMDFIPQVIKDSIAQQAKVSKYHNTDLNGDNYLKFMVNELKPVIDKTYSVHTEKENTFVAGSSMGGLMSMYAISEYPNIFGAAACLSTHWPGTVPVEDNPVSDAIFSYMKVNLPSSEQHRIYFDYGNKTLDEHYPQYAPRVNEILKEKGYTTQNSRNILFEDTDHSENSWNQRLDIPLTFLLGH